MTRKQLQAALRLRVGSMSPQERSLLLRRIGAALEQERGQFQRLLQEAYTDVEVISVEAAFDGGFPTSHDRSR